MIITASQKAARAANGRKSRGPITPEGLERAKRGNWKHGRYSRQAIADRQLLQEWMRYCQKTLQEAIYKLEIVP